MTFWKDNDEGVGNEVFFNLVSMCEVGKSDKILRILYLNT